LFAKVADPVLTVVSLGIDGYRLYRKSDKENLVNSDQNIELLKAEIASLRTALDIYELSPETIATILTAVKELEFCVVYIDESRNVPERFIQTSGSVAGGFAGAAAGGASGAWAGAESGAIAGL